MTHLKIVAKPMYQSSQICFAKLNASNELIWHEPGGNGRIIFLQMLLDGEPLPEGIRIATQVYGGLREVTPDQIDWSTCGLRPGGKGRFIW